jgi:hypothetical protein
MLQLKSDAFSADPRETRHVCDSAPGTKHRLRTLREVKLARRRRRDFFSAQLFGDYAWDLLLELHTAELEQRRIAVTGLCEASEVPLTTGLRWIEAFAKEGLIQKRPDPLDARRWFISLSPEGLSAMAAYLATIPIAWPTHSLADN